MSYYAEIAWRRPTAERRVSDFIDTQNVGKSDTHRTSRFYSGIKQAKGFKCRMIRHLKLSKENRGISGTEIGSGWREAPFHLGGRASWRAARRAAFPWCGREAPFHLGGRASWRAGVAEARPRSRAKRGPRKSDTSRALPKPRQADFSWEGRAHDGGRREASSPLVNAARQQRGAPPFSLSPAPRTPEGAPGTRRGRARRDARGSAA